MSVNPSDRHRFGMVTAPTAIPCESSTYTSTDSCPKPATPTLMLSILEDMHDRAASDDQSTAYGHE